MLPSMTGPSERVGFLTREWARALEEAARASPDLRNAVAGIPLSIQQVVTDAGGAEVRYVVVFGDDDVRVEWGEGTGADVTLRLSRQTAVALNRGDLNAQHAFVEGLLRVGGDLSKLAAARDALMRLEDVFAALRERTDY